VHLPFVHYNTIGRGNRTLINGPLLRVEEKENGSDIFNIWVDNEVDQGQSPIKSEKMPEPQRNAFLQFRFPNLWQNCISDDMRIFIAFSPVDEENTLMYIRYYQKIVKLPVLKDIFNLFGTLGNLVIERQDKRVVVTQQPKRSDLRIGEKLIQGDGPIIEYRRRRQALIESAQGAQISKPQTS
jgi:phenylpropionate dioxygenase-like ring-hydroxylating dioxygenase large terminal subunit